jgi:hypothetical protein
MADSAHQIGPNFRDKIAKAAALRLADAAARSTTDYFELIVGDGAPSGGYGRDSGASMLYARKDASSNDTVLYVTYDGGTTWAAFTSGGQAQGDVLDDLNTLGASTTDGEFLVATGAGALAWEAGATARTSLGVGTGDSPSFTGLTLSGGEISLGDLAGSPGTEGDLAYNGDHLELHNGAGAVSLLDTASEYFVKATIAVADATGGATGAALTLDLFELDGTTTLSGAKQVMIRTSGSQYDPSSVNTNVTFGTATKGSIIASGSGWCLAETDAAGEFDCTASNSSDETVYFGVTAPAAGQSDTSKGVLGVISNSDAATWSA